MIIYDKLLIKTSSWSNYYIFDKIRKLLPWQIEIEICMNKKRKTRIVTKFYFFLNMTIWLYDKLLIKNMFYIKLLHFWQNYKITTIWQIRRTLASQLLLAPSRQLLPLTLSHAAQQSEKYQISNIPNTSFYKYQTTKILTGILVT